MYFWKIDDETIRCLVNKQEIDKMGYDLEVLDKNDDAMMDFLNDIIDESLHYVDWNPEHGLQNYAARILPANQLLVTISCTYPDELIDKDLKQIEKLTRELQNKISPERLEEIYHLTGEEKQEAFDSLTKDLHAIYSGQLDENEGNETREPVEHVKAFQMQDQILIFETFNQALHFCQLLSKKFMIPSKLYKAKEHYELLVKMSFCQNKQDADTFLGLAKECGSEIIDAGLRESYLREHGKVMIEENAIQRLQGFK